MKVPIRWLNEYVDVALPPSDYAAKMIMGGIGVEEITTLGSDFSGVVAGRVLSIEKMENSDHLLVCRVDVGAKTIQIVTGAQNVFAGALVPVALSGATLPGGKVIRSGRLRGALSEGMLCSGPELGVSDGLYPGVGDAGILILRGDCAPGDDVHAPLGLVGDVIDFEILANRPDCLSVWGIARETAAVLRRELRLPEISVREADVAPLESAVRIDVPDDALCPRYCARMVANVRVAPSPMWLRERLNAAGVRPINNIVDITNYVMLETGHPMHAFDLDRVRDGRIVVRRARPGEQLTTLDGKAHTLTDNMLVIADAERATGLAGIMGGEESEITETTRRVLFECAAFDRTGIRLTARALGIRTESSGRFERGVCPATAKEAIERACMLVNLLDAGDVAPGLFDHYPRPLPERAVRAEVARIRRLTGVDIAGDEMAALMAALGVPATLENGVLTCRVPARRMDLETEADIAEEVLRLHGYDALPSTLMRGVTMPGGRSGWQTFADRLKAAMVGMGFYEIATFSFVSPRWLRGVGLAEGDRRLTPVVLKNPLGEDTSVMRTTLLPSMLSAMALNISRGNASGKLFEVGAQFLPAGEGNLPEETQTLCAGMFGEGADFYALRDSLIGLLAAFGIRAEVAAGGDGSFHPGRKALLRAGGVELGQVGEVHPDTAGNFEIDRRVYAAWLNLALVRSAARPIIGSAPLPRFPAVSRDMALVVDEAVEVGPLMAALAASGGAALEDVRLFDVYRGAQLGEGKKSAAFALTFRAPDRTLTDAEVDVAMAAMRSACADRFGAKIRA
ncbi:MAG: phenylalanine--tRNA ligase subunit beta [Clostridiales bacterium]|nr:phenylalanine--tRNA ligase subunit beta [Clostridiales bacterium]